MGSFTKLNALFLVLVSLQFGTAHAQPPCLERTLAAVDHFDSRKSPEYVVAEARAAEIWGGFEGWLKTDKYFEKNAVKDLKKIKRQFFFQNIRAAYNRFISRLKNKISFGAFKILLHRAHMGADVGPLEQSFKFIHFREFGKLPKNGASQSSMKILKNVFSEVALAAESLTPADASLTGIKNRLGLKPGEKLKLPGGEHLLKPEQQEWLKSRIKEAVDVIPPDVLKEYGLAKMLKVMFGVVTYRLETLDVAKLSKEELNAEVFKSIQGGYYFGLTYPLVDDVMDSKAILSTGQKKKFNDLIMRGLNGEAISAKEIPNDPLAHKLKDIFDNLSELYPFAKNKRLYEAMSVLATAQTLDAEKVLSNFYQPPEVFVPTILKAAYSRITTARLSKLGDTYPEDHAMMIGLYNQLTDDFLDFQKDRQGGNITPFTYYLKDKSVPNPFKVYLGTAYYYSKVFGPEAQAYMLNRIGTNLGNYVGIYGKDSLKSYLREFDLEGTPLGKAILDLADTARHQKKDDEYMFRHGQDAILQKYPKQTRRSLKDFIKTNEPWINESILINRRSADPAQKELVDSMNYSLNAGGKRLRPLLTLMLADELGVNREAVAPLAKSVEYMHTSSLILDDLPAQDNAEMRRGSPTNHRAFKESTSQLASVSLLTEAFDNLTQLRGEFPPERVLDVVSYISRSVGHDGLSWGQVKDLANGANSDIAELEQVSHLKTGLAIEASLLPLAKLKGLPETQVGALKEYAREMGLVFQIRDDILDVTGDSAAMGKDAGIDVDNDRKNFVSILGLDGAQSELEQHRKRAHDALDRGQFSSQLFHQVIDYAATREK